MILENSLTSSFKQIIRNELYDTGALYESMEIYSEELPGQILVKVVCNDYIIYHIERLNLLTRLVKLPEFSEVCKNYYVIALKKHLVAKLNGESTDINQAVPDVKLVIESV